MSFNETARFPLQIALGAQGGPEYTTNIITVDNGFESRTAVWSASRLKFDIGTRPMTKADTDALIAFFRSVKGRAYGFRFRDWSDYQATTDNGGFTAIAGATYQMVKTYASGSLSEVRSISKPVAGTVSVSGSGVYSIDYTTGILTVASGAAPTAWSGEFDVPVRFDTDTMQLDAINKNGESLLIQWGQIPILEVRV